MSKSKKLKNKIKKELDFNQVSDISDHISELMDRIGYEDMTSEISDLDRKFVEKVEGLDSDQMQKLASDLKKVTSSGLSESSKNKTSIFSNIRAEYAVMAFLLLLVIAVGGISYLWPSDQDEIQFAGNELADEISSPTVLMQPAKFTQSGYVDKESDFIFEVAGEFTDQPEDVIKVEPPIPMDITAEQKDDITILTAVPQQELERDARYVFSIPANTSFTDGSTLGEKLDWSVVVDPIFSVVATSPIDGEKGVPIDTTVEFQFNHKNIELNDFKESFEIVPDTAGEFFSEGKNMIFVPENNLKKNTQYNVTLSKLFSNSIGESLKEDETIQFTTSDRALGEASEIESPKWVDYGGRDIVQMSGSIVTSVDFGSEEEITYSIVDWSEGVPLEDIINQYLESSLFPDVEEDSPLNSTKLRSGEFYSFQPKKNGVYKLTATDGEESLERVVLFSDIAPVVFEDEGRFTGWVVDLLQSQSPGDVEVVSYLNGKEIERNTLDESHSFSTPKADYVLISSPAGDGVWLSGWDVTSVSWESPYHEADEDLEILTDQPYYAQGDRIKYYVYFGDLLERDMATTDYSNLSLALEVGTHTSRESFTQFERSSVLMDSKDFSVSGSLKLPTDDNSTLVRLVLYNNESEIASKWLDVVSPLSSDDTAKLIIDKEKYLLGESIIISVEGADAGSSYQIKAYGESMANSLAGTDYQFKSLFWGAEDLIETYDIEADEMGDGKLIFSPYDRTIDSAYNSYTFVLLKDGSEAPIDVVSLGVAESLIVMDFEKESSGLITEDESVMVTFNSVNPWSLTPVGNVSFSYYPEIIEDVVFSRGDLRSPYTGELIDGFPSKNKVVKKPVQLVTDSSGSISYEIENLQVGTYYVHTEVGETKQEVGSFEVVDKNEGNKVALGIDNQEILFSDRITANNQEVDVRFTSGPDQEGVFFLSDGESYQSERITFTDSLPNLRDLTVSGSSDNPPEACLFRLVKSDISNGLSGGCKGIVLK